MVLKPKPSKNDRFPASFAYDDAQKARIFEALLLLRSEASSPLDFAERLVDRFERSPNFNYERNDGKTLESPAREGGADLIVAIRSKEQLSKYYNWTFEDFIKKNLTRSTWRFLDICSQLIRRDTGLVLSPEVFRPFGSECVALADVLLAPGTQNLFLQPVAKQASYRSGILCIGAAEDEFHARVKLWISIDPQASKQQIEADVIAENYEYVRRWDGLIRFAKPPRGLAEQQSVFSGYDAVSIIREYRNSTPGTLRIGRQHNDYSNCVLSTPHSESEYELQILEGL